MTAPLAWPRKVVLITAGRRHSDNCIKVDPVYDAGVIGVFGLGVADTNRR
jgi:hypothetical protein